MSDLFLKVLNLSISAGYLVIAVVLLRLLLKKAPRWVFPLLWGLVALRLLVPFSVESVLSLIPSAEPIPPDIAVVRNPAINSGIPAVNRVVNPVIAQSFTPDPVASVNPLQIWLWLGGWAWLAGMALMLLYTAFTYLRLCRRVSAAVRLRGNQYQCDAVASPFVLGLLRPRIYLPFGLKEEELPYIVAHEEAHIRRRDHFWKPLGFLLLAVHWFNPLMWLAYILLCRDIELACDEKVIKSLGREGRADYSQALLSCSVSRRSIAACPLAFGEVGVKERVRSVLNYKKPAFWIVALAVVSSIVLAVCFLTDPRKEPTKVEPGRYRAGEILYSTEEPQPGEDIFTCKILEDRTLYLRKSGGEWEFLGQMEARELTDEEFNKLIRLPDKWLSGSREDVGEICDAWSTGWQQGMDTYVIFSTEEETYLARCAVVGYDQLFFISQLVSLEKTEPRAEEVPFDAAMWGVSLEVKECSASGAEVVFVQQGEKPEGELLGGNDYCLQRYELDTWVDVSPLVTPNWAEASYPLDGRRHEIDWEWLYGRLPDGRYRMGKQVWRRSQQADGGSAMAYGEFYLGEGPREPWELTLSIDTVTPTGATASFWQFTGELAEGLSAGEDFVLQAYENGAWKDLPTLVSPAFGPETSPLDDEPHSFPADWSAIYGALPDGRYRMGKTVYGPGDQSHRIYGEFSLSLYGKKDLLTVEDILALMEQGRPLTFEDLEKYPYVDTWDDGGPEFMDMARFFEMKDNMRFIIRYARESGKIYHMGLNCSVCGEYEILRGEEGITPWNRYFIDLHTKPLAEGQTTHWGITLALDNVTDTGADLRYEGTTPADTEFWSGDLYTLERLTALGTWEELPVLDGREDQNFAPEKFRDQRVNWEKRYGALPEGTYRLSKRLDVHSVWLEEQQSYTAGQSLTLQAEFRIGNVYSSDWFLDMAMENGTPGGALVVFSCRENPEIGVELWRDEGYVLQQKQGSRWTDLKGSPVEAGAATPVYSGDAQFIDWQSTCGTLPDGEYRLGKKITLRYSSGRTREQMFYEEFRVDTSGSRGKLTAADVLRLCDKGYDLTWADLEPFDYLETWGGPAIIQLHRLYDLDGPLKLSINGEAADKKPQNISMTCEIPGEPGSWVDLMRFSKEQVADYIGVHGKALPQGQTNHYGVTLAVEQACPTGARLVFRAPEDYRGSAQYRLRRLTAGGVWEDLTPLEPWGREQFLTSYVHDQFIRWEDRYGVLPQGTYRLEKNVQGTGYSSPFHAEFTIESGVSITAQDVTPEHVVLKFHRTPDTVGEYYFLAGYTLEQAQNGLWVPLDPGSSPRESIDSQIDFDWYSQDPANGLFIGWDRLGPLADGRYRIGYEIADNRDLSKANRSMVYAEFQVDTRNWTGGVRPLEDLPLGYHPEDAEMDGCVVTQNGELRFGEEIFRGFREAVDRKEPAFVRVMSVFPRFDGKPRDYVHDLSFDGSRFTLRWLEDGRENVLYYRYLKHFEGQREAVTNTLENYEYYVLTNEASPSLEKIEEMDASDAHGRMGHHFTVYGLHTIQPRLARLPGKPVAADLKFGGEILVTTEDPERLEKLHWLFTSAEIMGYEPKTHNIGIGLELVLRSESGDRVVIELDPCGDICRIDGEFCFYGGYDQPDRVPLVWECLGIDAWPAEVYEKCPDALL